MSTVRANNYYDASGGSNAQLYGVASPPNSMGFRNRIINGDMRIDQRYAGASATPTGDYVLDRFLMYRSGGAFSVQRSTTAPAGFVNSMLITNTTPASPTTYSFFGQIIEGFNIADLGFGGANAQTITVSFWVRSSVTGIYSISLTNGSSSRAYPVQYTINAANTWEYKTITIPGDTTGTWSTDNLGGMFLRINLGSGSARTAPSGAWVAGNYDGANGSTGATTWANTSSATFYITGVQLEAGTVASPFERRDYGRELMMCQRYYEKSYNIDVVPGTNSTAGRFESSGASDQASNQIATIRFAVAKRAAPTMSGWTSTGTSGSWDYGRSGASGAVTVNFAYTSTFSFSPYVGVGTGWVPSTMIGHWVASAEL